MRYVIEVNVCNGLDCWENVHVIESDDIDRFEFDLLTLIENNQEVQIQNNNYYFGLDSEDGSYQIFTLDEWVNKKLKG